MSGQNSIHHPITEKQILVHRSNLHLTFISFADFGISQPISRRRLRWQLSAIVNGRHGECSCDTRTSTRLITTLLPSSAVWKTNLYIAGWLKSLRKQVNDDSKHSKNDNIFLLRLQLVMYWVAHNKWNEHTCFTIRQFLKWLASITAEKSGHVEQWTLFWLVA